MIKFACGAICLLATIGLTAQIIPNYQTNIDTAKNLAQTENRSILMVFAGSDWCRPCIQFKKDILESAAFQLYAKENLVILYLDFPARRKNQLPDEQRKHNEALAEQFNKSGRFPNILLLSPQGEVLSPLTFSNQSPTDFIAEITRQGT
ncbi:MAG: thioredoxin family protein [Saprospiraceae bacterium]